MKTEYQQYNQPISMPGCQVVSLDPHAAKEPRDKPQSS